MAQVKHDTRSCTCLTCLSTNSAGNFFSLSLSLRNVSHRKNLQPSRIFGCGRVFSGWRAAMMHHSRKYSPQRHCDVGSQLPQLNRLPTSRMQEGEPAEKNSPRAKSRMRHAKVKARKAASPQRPRVSPKPAPVVENGGAGQRSRKKGFKPPDVRTIFEAKDPRVKEERGEGHAFSEDAAHAWCDVCCSYIFQGGLTCTGELYRSVYSSIVLSVQIL